MKGCDAMVMQSTVNEETGKHSSCQPCHKVNEGKEKGLVLGQVPRCEAEELDLSTTLPEAGSFPTHASTSQ